MFCHGFGYGLPSHWVPIRRPVDREYVAQRLVENVIEEYNTAYKAESRPLTSWQRFVSDFFARNRGCRFTMADCAQAYWISRVMVTDDEVAVYTGYEPVAYDTPESDLLAIEEEAELSGYTL